MKLMKRLAALLLAGAMAVGMTVSTAAKEFKTEKIDIEFLSSVKEGKQTAFEKELSNYIYKKSSKLDKSKLKEIKELNIYGDFVLINRDIKDFYGIDDYSFSYSVTNGILSIGKFGEEPIVQRKVNIENPKRTAIISKMGNLTNLNISYTGLKDISFLKNSTNLTSLSLCNNQISDISALASLTNLNSLSLSGNNISDISALKGLVNLYFLSFGENNVSDVSALKNLTNLVSLEYTNTPAAKDPSNAQILWKSLRNCTIYTDWEVEPSAPRGDADIDGIVSIGEKEYSEDVIELKLDGWYEIEQFDKKISKFKKLKKLTINGSHVDLSGLKSLKNLTYLDLSRCSVKDFKFLKGLKNLNTLKIASGDIDVLPDLSALKNLTSLSLSGFKDISNLKKSNGFKALHLSIDLGSNTVDLSALNSLTQLTSLEIRGYFIQLPALKKLTKLQSLELTADSSISNISSLKNLKNLKELHFYGSVQNASDFSSLKALTSLEILEIHANYHGEAGGDALENISFLKNLTSLKTLDLSDNLISDISVLKYLTALKSLNLGGNPISDLSGLKNLTSLNFLDLSIYDKNAVTKFFKKNNDFKNLKELCIYESASDSSVLKKLPALKKLTIYAFDSEEAGTKLEKLKKKLPKCEIHAEEMDPYLYIHIK